MAGVAVGSAMVGLGLAVAVAVAVGSGVEVGGVVGVSVATGVGVAVGTWAVLGVQALNSTSSTSNQGLRRMDDMIGSKVEISLWFMRCRGEASPTKCSLCSPGHMASDASPLRDGTSR